MKPIKTAFMIATALILVSYSPVARATTDTPSSNPAEHEKHHLKRADPMKPSAEMRKTMAQMHQVMADCLKSDRPIADCKQEMMNNCPMKKSGHCEMMDQMGGEMGEPMEGYSRQKKDIKSPKEGATIQEAHHPLQH